MFTTFTPQDSQKYFRDRYRLFQKILKHIFLPYLLVLDNEAAFDIGKCGKELDL